MSDLKDGDILFDKEGKPVGMARYDEKRRTFIITQNVTDDQGFIEWARNNNLLHKPGVE